MPAERQDPEAIFWRAFLRRVGPALGVTEEEIEGMTDELIVAAGRGFVEGFAPAFETVGRLVARGVNAYHQERKP